MDSAEPVIQDGSDMEYTSKKPADDLVTSSELKDNLSSEDQPTASSTGAPNSSSDHEAECGNNSANVGSEEVEQQEVPEPLGMRRLS